MLELFEREYYTLSHLSHPAIVQAFDVMYGLALIEAGMGLRSSLEWAQTLETEPLHAVNALQVRMVHELWLGRVREADDMRERAELRRIESGSRQMGDGSHLVWQMLASPGFGRVHRRKTLEASCGRCICTLRPAEP